MAPRHLETTCVPAHLQRSTALGLSDAPAFLNLAFPQPGVLLAAKSGYFQSCQMLPSMASSFTERRKTGGERERCQTKTLRHRGFAQVETSDPPQMSPAVFCRDQLTASGLGGGKFCLTFENFLFSFFHKGRWSFLNVCSMQRIKSQPQALNSNVTLLGVCITQLKCSPRGCFTHGDRHVSFPHCCCSCLYRTVLGG